jgi:Replication-relaxation
MSEHRTRYRPPLDLTDRDLNILKKLAAAGWLSSRQIRDYFFPGRSMNAVCKRLRKLVAAGYLATARTSSTGPGLYRLAKYGKLHLIEQAELSAEEVSIPTRLPQRIEHFMAVNDLRLYFERMVEGAEAEILYFFGEREFAGLCQKQQSGCGTVLNLLKRYRIIPDAVARIRIMQGCIAREVDLFIEYDAGTENAAFFGRTKIKEYGALFTQNREVLGNLRMITFAGSVRRIVSLMRQAVLHQPPQRLFYFALIEKLSRYGWQREEIFLDPFDFFVPVRRGVHVEVLEKEIRPESIPKHALVALPPASPRRVSSHEERHY